ncbi:ISAs1 family transposase, partial [Pseudaquabacterium rugosum]
VACVQSMRQQVRAGRYAARGAEPAQQSWRYYISSDVLDAQTFNATVRAHWSIENDCHWVLDVNYREDEWLIRRAHGPHNMATLRRIAQNQIKLDVGKGSQKTKRKRMGWSDDYLQGLFGLTPCSALQPQVTAVG